VGASLFNLSNCRKGTSQTQPKILLDGQSLQWQDVKADDKVELCLRDRTWGRCTALARAERSGEDFGPIRQIFARGVCGIFGSEAHEENALRFLANMLLMSLGEC
ncbi:FMP42, partial [Symbiodinium necroappetens]